MKRLVSVIFVIFLVTGCASSKDLAKTLRYADNTVVGIDDIKFKDLDTMKRGDACTWNIFYFLPIQGDGSIITAANQGGIDSVELIGQTGYWAFPFSKNCTVVFGDSEEQV